ncbi:SH3 domain-containing C40 family peptidase [uncultured Polaribacter sp.]|uniref:SH3 domain-containing C40 family peptidase n=1 Tax=uncultured Polaribacter sp. TaxID=174711 RepID=UPI002617892E|nr:SH3 domain-containing C40 family peptidase [uncultured Polaribacter sp.]
MTKSLKPIFLLLLLISVACSDNNQLIQQLESINNTFKNEFAPDKRVAIFDVNFSRENNKIIINGATDTKEAHQKLLDSLQSLKIDFADKIRVLPDSIVGNKMYAVAKNSVINIRSKPKHSAELGTQGLLGMSLKILDKEGDFYRIQTPDNYISWVDKGGIAKMNKNEIENWNASKKIIFTKNFGYVYTDKNEKSSIVSDITLGGILKYLSEDSNYYEVKYPDNRTGFVKKSEAVIYNSWLNHLASTKNDIETTARAMQGFPYLWGGTSSKGVDCSGFTKMVYLMNGFVIPRDASQQINAGKTVDTNLDFSDLQKGDLLFFGTKATEDKKQRIVHVGIWLGNHKMEFIHASGNVHLSSMDKNQPNYDEFNKNRYLGSRRYLGTKDKMIVDLKTQLKL